MRLSIVSMLLLVAIFAHGTDAQGFLSVYITSEPGVMSPFESPVSCLTLANNPATPTYIPSSQIIEHDGTTQCQVFLMGSAPWNAMLLEFSLAKGASVVLYGYDPVSYLGVKAYGKETLDTQATLGIRGQWNHTAFDIHGVSTVTLQNVIMRDVIMSFPANASVIIGEGSSFTYTPNAVTSAKPITSLVPGQASLTAQGTLPFILSLSNDAATAVSNSYGFISTNTRFKCTVSDGTGSTGSICESLLDVSGARQLTVELSGEVSDFPTLMSGTPDETTTLLLQDLTIARDNLAFNAGLPGSRDQYYSIPMISATGYAALKLNNVQMSGTYTASSWKLFGSPAPPSLDITQSNLKYVSFTLAPISGFIPSTRFSSTTFINSHLVVRNEAILEISNGVFLRTQDYIVARPLVFFQDYIPSASNRIDALAAGWFENSYAQQLLPGTVPHLLLLNSSITLLHVTSSLSVDLLGLIGSSFINGSLAVRRRIDPYTLDTASLNVTLGPTSALIRGGPGSPSMTPPIAYDSLQVPALTVGPISPGSSSVLTLYCIDINGVQVNTNLPVRYLFNIVGSPILLSGISPRLWNATFNELTDSHSNLIPSSTSGSMSEQSSAPLPRIDIEWAIQGSSIVAGQTYPLLSFSPINVGNDRFSALPGIQSNPPLTTDTTDYKHMFLDSSNRTVRFYTGNICPLPAPSPPELFRCSNGDWIYNPPTSGAPSASPSTGPTTVIVVSAPITVIGDFDTTGVSLVFPGLTTSITVQGCANLPSNVTIHLTLEEIQQLSGSTAYLLIETNCSTPISTGSSALIIDRDENSCRKVRGRLETRRTGIVALFDVDDSDCKSSNRWWIILVSVVCGVLFIVIVLVLIFTLVPSARRLVRPYTARKDQQEAGAANVH